MAQGRTTARNKRASIAGDISYHSVQYGEESWRMIKIMLNHKLEGFRNLRLLGIEEIKNTEGGRNRKEINEYKKAIELTNTDQSA